MLRFLIVDDNRDDALMLTWLIEEKHAREAKCEFATSRAEALAWLDPGKHEPFDAILLDLNLRDARGLETFRPIRAASRPIPIVILSGRDDERGLRDLLLEEGAENYFAKGHLAPTDIFEALRDAVTRSRSRARLSQEEALVLEEASTRNDRMIQRLRKARADDDPTRLIGEAQFASHRMTQTLHKRLMALADAVVIAVGKIERVDDASTTARTTALSAQDAAKVLEDRGRSHDETLVALEAKVKRTERLALRTKRRLQAFVGVVGFIGIGAGSKGTEILGFLAKIFGAE